LSAAILEDLEGLFGVGVGRIGRREVERHGVLQRVQTQAE
jgi:hypothetical protein